ncbi:MAG TPA: putative toxin-antitoxin system toxin component, PIN family [Thermomicrobiales bacterium]|nr:putative toxin-antitoxin system toxin component, PIN family [Thermomicrobiales bacterium]
MNSDAVLTRVVVDTNLFVSGTISVRSALYQCLDWIATNPSALLTSPYQQAEILSVLSRPAIARRFNVTDPARLLVSELLATAEVIDVTGFKLGIEVRDPDDEPIPASALIGNAGFLVTGDHDLLSLAGDPRLGRLRIVTAREFLDALPA